MTLSMNTSAAEGGSDITDARGVRMTIAYLILAHAHPRQLARLVAALPHGSPVFIHIDARSPDAVVEETQALLSGRPQVFFVPRHRCWWARIGIVRGTMSLIDALVGSGVTFDYASLLSGACYPIRSNEEIDRFLAEHAGQEHIECFPLDRPNRWSSDGGLSTAPGRVLRFHLTFRSRIIRTPILRKLPMGYRPFGGGQWWTLSRAAVTHVASVAARHPRLMRFFAHSFAPDESYVQTILGNSEFVGRVTGDDQRLTIWDRPKPPFPAVLRGEDLPLMRASGKLYARKFSDTVDADVYGRIDAELRRPPVEG